MVKINIYLICLFILFPLFGITQQCNCNHGVPVINFRDRVVVCGNDADTISHLEWMVSDFVLMDCKADSILDDNSNENVTKFFFKDCVDSLVEILTTYLPDSSMKIYTLAPLYYHSITFDRHGKLIYGGAKYCFNTFGLNKHQEKVIDDLCDSLEFKISKKDSNFSPYDEHSLYILFMGAINEKPRAKSLFENIRKYFKMNYGALSETLNHELPYRDIMFHKNPDW